jgi:UDP-N-acetyl-D-mannosaminuronic acid dehydrogenase
LADIEEVKEDRSVPVSSLLPSTVVLEIAWEPHASAAPVYDLVVVGGFGHVGLPLAIAFASKGQRVCALDIDSIRAKTIGAGQMPFLEIGCEKKLQEVLQNGNLALSIDPMMISRAASVIIVTGTPVDRHLNPELEPMRELLAFYQRYFMDGQLIVLRSTVYPGTTDWLSRWFVDHQLRVDLAFCPERIAEGHALEELAGLPQIISAQSENGLRRARELFSSIAPEIVELTPIEAELAKLFSNVWRYTLFATANQFFMLANDHGADFHRIHHAMTHHYPRVKDLPKPGFAAGPCLFKDTMQLAAFNSNRFYLGHAAMLVNEGLPNYLVDRLKLRYPLSTMSVGILGMTFKANSDDRRESLSYKLRKVLSFECQEVLCSDVYLKEPGFVDVPTLIKHSDVIILAAPHDEYRSLVIPPGKVLIDIWNAFGHGCII